MNKIRRVLLAMMPLARAPRSQTLQRTWAGATARLVVIIIVLGVVGIGATQHQRRMFTQTTDVLHRDMQAVVDADLAHLGITASGTELMYRINGYHPEQSVAEYQRARARLNAALLDLRGTISSDEAAALVEAASSSWAATDAGILAAADLTAEQLQAAFSSGADPHLETVWDPYNATVATFSELAQQVVDDLRLHAEEASQAQRFVVPAVLAGLALALLVAWATARLVSRQVVTPLTELRRGAIDLRDLHVTRTIDLTGSVSELEDIAEVFNETAWALQASHGLLRHQARTDVLTGLPNRAAFADHVSDRLTAPGGQPVSVLFVDLDDFKVVNDSLGHAAGDELLSVVATRLQSIIGGDEIVARLGGDEFALAIDGDTTSATAVADRALAALHDVVCIDGHRLIVGCSIGIATAEPNGTVDGAELARRADFAMYMAKSQGKSCFEVFSPAMHTEVAGRTRLKEQLADAAGNGELVLHYQPVVELRSGRVQGFEALVRWNHPERGLLSPAEFIELAEETGDIIALGAWVLDQACSDLAVHHRQAGEASQWISVNVSLHQITGPAFSHTVLGALRRNDLQPASLVLEVTEGTAMADGDGAVREALAELRRHGIRIALDDFGMGFSSLRHLHELPIDVLKIDRSFICDPSACADTMIEAIVNLAGRLSLDVIAEGIEHAGEADRLQRFGAIGGQGYLYGRPAPADTTLFASTADDAPLLGDEVLT